MVSFDGSLLKGEGQRLSANFARPSYCDKVLERLLVYSLAIWKPIGMAEMYVHCVCQMRKKVSNFDLIGGTMCALCNVHL